MKLYTRVRKNRRDIRHLWRIGPPARIGFPVSGGCLVSLRPRPEAYETPVVFANKVYASPLPGGAKVTFAEARHISGEDPASPRVAVFLQHADLAVLRRLLDCTGSADVQPNASGHSVH